MGSCSVCCDSFNKTNHKKVTCPFCDFESCRKCVQTYMLSSIEDPHCMKCKHELNREFVDSFCTKRFRNTDYKKHRENVLFEREKVRMPETQPQVERIIKLRDLRHLYYELLNILAHIEIGRQDSYVVGVDPQYYDTWERDVRVRLEHTTDEMDRLRYMNVEEDTSRKFVRMCPTEDCRGFIDENWKCGLCKKTFCDKCFEPIEENHECNPELVKTMKLINKDTRPCPKCSTMIHKIDGCMQMWCTNCNTAFDWRSGTIVVGRIHNPHFFEFKKRSREHGDIPCGGRPTYSELSSAGAPDNILDMCAVLHKLDRDIMYKYGDIYDEDNTHLRISYMLNRISEEDFKIELQRRDKLKDKHLDIRNIYEMYTNACGDLMRQWMLDKSLDIMITIHELTMYSNSIITKIRNRYNASVPSNIVIPSP